MTELRERDFETFFRTPFDCYPETSHFVSLMRSDLARLLDGRRNPLFQRYGDFTYYTVCDGERSLGRVVAHVHHASNRRHGLCRGYFGFFDCADDVDVARTLLGRAADWVAELGCDELAGNFNLTAMQQVGVVTDGFEHAPYTDMHYNPPHIPRLLEACGFERFFPMTTHELALGAFDPEQLRTPAVDALLSDSELEWVPVRRRHFTSHLRAIREVLNASFDKNPMFVPVTEEEFLYQAKEMMWIIDPRLSKLVYSEGKPLGTVVCIPDLNRLLRRVRSRLGLSFPWHYVGHLRRRRHAVIIFWAVDPSAWGRGLNPAMLYAATRSLKDAGYESLGLTWIADGNKASLRQVEKLGARPLHRLHLFRKSVQGAR